MKLPRRKFLHLAAGAVALSAVSRVAWAQGYPARPVRIIVGFCCWQLTGRYRAPRGSSAFKPAWPAIPRRKSTRCGHQYCDRGGRACAPDGYTLLWVTTVNAINATLYDKLNFNFIRDIEPVTAVVRLPNIMVLHPSVPAKSVPEFIAYAKAHPGKINMAYSTSGGARTTASVAILVPAPGRFSTMTCWPSRVESA